MACSVSFDAIAASHQRLPGDAYIRGSCCISPPLHSTATPGVAQCNGRARRISVKQARVPPGRPQSSATMRRQGEARRPYVASRAFLGAAVPVLLQIKAAGISVSSFNSRWLGSLATFEITQGCGGPDSPHSTCLRYHHATSGLRVHRDTEPEP